jgi:hypothetical protein
MHLIALLVASWFHLFPLPAPGAHVGDSARQNPSAPALVSAPVASGDATSGLDPWG